MEQTPPARPPARERRRSSGEPIERLSDALALMREAQIVHGVMLEEVRAEHGRQLTKLDDIAAAVEPIAARYRDHAATERAAASIHAEQARTSEALRRWAHAVVSHPLFWPLVVGFVAHFFDLDANTLRALAGALTQSAALP